LTSSKVTKLGAKAKKILEDGYKTGGQRDIWQVLANGLFPTIIAFSYWMLVGQVGFCISSTETLSPSMLVLMYIGYYGCCNGDTWSSEIGILSTQYPIMITTLRKVPPGTNGGVTLLGTCSSGLGGLVIGLAAAGSIYLSNSCNLPIAKMIGIVCLGSICGLLGSLIDSLLGAIFQKTLYDEKKKQIVTSSNPDESLLMKMGRDVLTNNQVNLISATITSFLAPFMARILGLWSYE